MGTRAEFSFARDPVVEENCQSELNSRAKTHVLILHRLCLSGVVLRVVVSAST